MSDLSLQLPDLEVGPSATVWSEAFPAFQHEAAWASLEAESDNAAVMTLVITLEVSYSAQGPWFDALAAETALGGGLDLTAAASPAEASAAIAALGAAPYLRYKVVNSIAHTVTCKFGLGLGTSKADRHLGLGSTEPAEFKRIEGLEEDIAFTAAVETDTSRPVRLAGYDEVALFIEGDAALTGTAHLLFSTDRDGPFFEQAVLAGSDLSGSDPFEPARPSGVHYVKVRLKQTAAAAGSIKVSLFGR